MKTNKLPLMTIAALLVAVSLNACGKTNRSAASMESTASASAVPDPNCCSTMTNVNTSISTSTNTSVVLDSPLSFEFTALGGQAVITNPFQTDNTLKVKFVPGTTQGNNFHSASELAVTLVVNGTEFTPQYTSNNYTYGKVGEASKVIDISGYISPGSSMQIAVKNPKSDYYCTYAPNPFYYWDGTQYAPTNPLYNVYPGCRRDVFKSNTDSSKSHKWSGKVIVQTSHTSAI